MAENKQYKNAQEFADDHGDLDEGGESSLSELAKDVFSTSLNRLKEDVEFSIDPAGLWWRKPSEKELFQREMYKKQREADEKRPDISSLSFSTLPAEKAKGLKPKLALFAGEWNKFVDEIEAGRVEVAEALYLSAVDVKDASSAMDQRFYAKLADLNGNVIKGCVRVIVRDRRGVYPENMGGWMDPSDYMRAYPERTDEEFDAYEAYFWANACQDPVDPSDRKHVYVLRYTWKNQQCYGVIFEDEYNDIKKLKDYIPLTETDNIFKYNNFEPDFGW